MADETSSTPTESTGGPSWLLPLAMVLIIGGALFGIGAGIYMTQHHEIGLYGGADANFELQGCSEEAGYSCDAVNLSEYSEFLGVPLFTWAIPAYGWMIYLAAMVLRGRREQLTVLTVVGGFASVVSVVLWYISWGILQESCAWCMRLWTVNFASFALALAASGLRFPLPKMPGLLQAGGVYLVLAAASIGVQQTYRGQLLGDAADIDLDARVLETTPVAAAEEVDPREQVDPEGLLERRTWDTVGEDGEPAQLIVEPDDAWKGNPDAEVVLVEYADLECGYCKRTSGVIKRLYEAYKDDVLFVFKHYPMDPGCNPGVRNRRHRRACNAAIAAVCAKEQGKFWAFHDLAFKNQHQLKVDDLLTYAKEVGMDLQLFRQCATDDRTLERLRADGQSGKDLQLHGTPRIFVNGSIYRGGRAPRPMAQALEAALREAGQVVESKSSEVAQMDFGDDVRPIPADVPEMTRITHGDLDVYMDTFESGIDDAGKAFTGKHIVPGINMSWYAARDACEAAGKRLCTEEEWIAACQGAAAIDDDDDGQFADDLIEGRSYPYSDYHTKGRCWEDKDRDSFRPVYTGEMPGCRSRDGVYDLTGNMEEWVGTSEGEAVLLGGAYDTRDDKARCYRRNDTFGPGFANKRTGFRCCKDAN